MLILFIAGRLCAGALSRCRRAVPIVTEFVKSLKQGVASWIADFAWRVASQESVVERVCADEVHDLEVFEVRPHPKTSVKTGLLIVFTFSL